MPTNRYLAAQLTAALAQGEARAARRIVAALGRRMPPSAVAALLAAATEGAWAARGETLIWCSKNCPAVL